MHGSGRPLPRVMPYHQSFQPSLPSQSHQQVLAPVLSSRRDLAELKPDPGSAPVTAKRLAEGRRAGRLARTKLPATNHEALAALKRSTDDAERRVLREHLVRKNLPLVYAITARMGRTMALPLEDLRQVGSLGLLRAIEAYEPTRGRTLSSFAVPYIRGAIQQELRDRASLVRIPRPLWDLRRRATVLQDRRRRLGQPQLAPAQLAAALDCSPCQVVEALQVAMAVEMRSLDGPNPGEGNDEASGRPLLELLADPSSLAQAPVETSPVEDPLAWLLSDVSASSGALAQRPATAVDRPGGPDLAELSSRPQLPTGWPRTPQRSWLQHRLQALTLLERQLLVGHVCLGRSWAELGRELELHPRQVQRRTLALLSRLQTEGERWREGDATGQAQA